MSGKYYQGKFIPSNPKKYKGDPTDIWYRSSWECKFMDWLDKDSTVLEWSSEERIIPYISPLDNRCHRYFPDIFAKMKTKDGIKSFIIEIKPYAQTQEPKKPKRKTKKFLNEVMTYAVNDAKWKAAKEYCANNGYHFKIITEKDLFAANK